MNRTYPCPGDLIHVQRSEWYALNDGQCLRVCEFPGWGKEGRDVYVAPRDQVHTFWGPGHGAPDGILAERMSTAGGPLKTITKIMMPAPEFITRVTDDFRRWSDWPRAGGGIEYKRDVAIIASPALSR